MSLLPFIDIHTHHRHPESDTVKVVNLSPGGNIPAFNGKNFYSLGLHPWDATSTEENNVKLSMVEDGLEFDHVIFIGECGLDKISGADFDEQKRVFIAQAMMAEEFQKPLIIHCVRAYNEVLELYKAYRPGVSWILHGYTGNRQITEQFADKKFFFSFGKILLNEKAKVVETFKQLPLNMVFLETDEFNIPVKEIYNRAAELKNLSVDEMRKAVWNNFNLLENISFDI